VSFFLLLVFISELLSFPKDSLFACSTALLARSGNCPSYQTFALVNHLKLFCYLRRKFDKFLYVFIVVNPSSYHLDDSELLLLSSFA